MKTLISTLILGAGLVLGNLKSYGQEIWYTNKNLWKESTNNNKKEVIYDLEKDIQSISYHLKYAKYHYPDSGRICTYPRLSRDVFCTKKGRIVFNYEDTSKTCFPLEFFYDQKLTQIFNKENELIYQSLENVNISHHALMLADVRNKQKNLLNRVFWRFKKNK